MLEIKKKQIIFFLVTKDWILPQQQHNFLNKLREEYQKIPSYIKIDYTKKHKEFLKLSEKEAQRSMSSAEQPEQTEPRNTPSPKPNPENARREMSELDSRFESLVGRLSDRNQNKDF